jgi:hypothetical protein
VVLTRARVSALYERADPDCKVLALAWGPGLRVAKGGEQRAEPIDGGLVLGAEGAGRVAAAAEETLQVMAHPPMRTAGPRR